MQLKTNLKLGEVNNLSDARYAAGIGAQFVGFNLTPGHPQYIAPEKVQEIVGWMSGPSLVGEWDTALTDIIRDTHERLKLDYVQLNHYDPAQAAALKDLHLIQNFHLKPQHHAGDIVPMIEQVHQQGMIFMFSFEDAGSQDAFLSRQGNRLFFLELCRDYPVLLNFFFTPENTLSLLEDFAPFGINLKGSSEIKPGYKDFDELNDLVGLLETEDH